MRITRLLTALKVCAAIAAITPAALTAQAQTDAAIRKPAAAARVVHVFDFEERGVNNEPVPMRWVRGQDAPTRPRAGFPSWNRAEFDFAVARSGEASVRLPVRGGSASLRLAPGVIPVIPGGSYEVSAHVRTSDLRHARARLVARLHDGRLEPIADSERAGPPVVSASGWVETRVRIPGQFPQAAWLTIDLELLQPDLLPDYSDEPAGAVTEAPEDFTGVAWFDDVVVRIVPVARLHAGDSAGIVIFPEKTAVRAVIDDVAGDPLRTELRVRSIDGDVVDSFTVDPVRPGQEIAWKPNIPALGWWNVEIDVFAGETVVAAESRPIAWIRQTSPTADRAKFGVILDRAVGAPRDALLGLIDATGAGDVEVPLWRAGPARDDARAEAVAITPLLEDLILRSLVIGFSLERLPAALARELRVDPVSLLDALAASPNTWTPWVEDALSRFGQRVPRWRLGSIDTRRIDDPARRAALFESAAEPLRNRVLNPRPITIWPTEIEPPPTLTGNKTLLSWTNGTPPDAALDHAAIWPGYSAAAVLIEPIGEAADLAPGGGGRIVAADLARRAARAWQAGAGRIMLRQPWDWSSIDDDAANLRARPSPLLPVWRTLTAGLGDRRVVGVLPIADGAVALVLDGPAGGAIIAWNESAPVSEARIEAHLAEGPVRVVDLFGNERTVERSDLGHIVELGPEPIFIEGVDAELARFRAAFRVAPSRVESTAERHAIELILRNPWTIAINGDLRIVEPADWSFTPRAQVFALGPGEEIRLPVAVSFGLAAEAGRLRLRAETRLVAGERYPTITLDAPIDLALTGVELLPSYQVQREDGREDLVVTALIINTGDRPTTLTSYAQAPGQKRLQATISGLEPRAAAVRRFVFPGAAKELLGADVQVGVIEAVGLGRLTHRLKIE